MPHIYDNIVEELLPALRATLAISERADFCVGYFNLRGWGKLADLVEHLTGADGSCCRVLVGMQRAPEELMRLAQSAVWSGEGVVRTEDLLDGPTLARLQRAAAQAFKDQLETGLPTAQAEAALRRLARQLRAGKVCVKVYLAHPLHAKLYLMTRDDPITPLIGYLGSSNLTQAGLAKQGELNVDVVEQDAAHKLQRWFDDRWGDPLAIDLSEELARLIETSWASEQPVSPYLVYLKIAYHLSEEARQGEREFKLPPVFRGILLDFQERAVSMAAHILHQRNGVLLADVVGLGKTLMATAVARIYQEDQNCHTLIICPPKLMEMWRSYVRQYGLTADVESLGGVINRLPQLRPPSRDSLLIIDESHNLRNREGARYHAIHDYIERWAPRVLLLTATPYNKQYADLGNQLRLLLDEEQDLRQRPERFFQEWRRQNLRDADFIARYQTLPTSLRAFEQSEFADDWRDLMRLYMVRRTRSFIMRNYAQYDAAKQRHYVLLQGQPSYFPLREPKLIPFGLDAQDPHDQYARLYADDVVQVIADLALPRYGLANYLAPNADKRATPEEKAVLEALNRAGRRLIGFTRTNLFKRLESSGSSFVLSLRRHILRNLVTLYALEHNLPLPIGTQSASLLDTTVTDGDQDVAAAEDTDEAPGPTDEQASAEGSLPARCDGLTPYRQAAQAVYQSYREQFLRRFKWLPARFLRPDLGQDLLADAQALCAVLQRVGDWLPAHDAKLAALQGLLAGMHPRDKVLVFSQFADTALYLGEHLLARDLREVAVATRDTEDPTTLVRRFSPGSNGGLRPGESELRVLIATDVLAEGQNLQDAHIVVNYDLPWAIVRLIQRAGRVDRIGQKHDTIQAYSFLPAEGVEQLIRLRQRLVARLEQNQEVVGTDESFFGEEAANRLRDLYAERAGAVDDPPDDDNDLSSTALQVWNSASEADRQRAARLPLVAPAARAHAASALDPAGAIVYLDFDDRSDALVRLDEGGQVVSQSLGAVFRSAACAPDTPALPRAANHHELVAAAVRNAINEQLALGGQLGTLRSTRRKVYERLRAYRERLRLSPTLFSAPELERLEPAFNALFRYTLTDRATESLGRQLRLGIKDEELAAMLVDLHASNRLSVVKDVAEQPEPKIVCSLGLREE